MSAASPVSDYKANPYIAFSLRNPFMEVANTEKAASIIAIGKGGFNTSYVPKIEDLLEVAKSEKFHIFKAMIHTRLFNLHEASSSGETLTSFLYRIGDKRLAYIEILSDEGIDLESLAPLSFWQKGSSLSLNDKVNACAYRVFSAKELEHKLLKLLKDNGLTADTLEDLKKSIISQKPYINLERILNAALYSDKADALIEFLLAQGAKSIRCKDAAAYMEKMAHANPDSATLKALAKTTCPAILPSRDSIGKTVVLSRRTTELLKELSYPGTKEHLLRSELSAVFGLHIWTATFDRLTRPDSRLMREDTLDFFTEIKLAGGIPESSIILTEKDLPLSPEKFGEITSDPSIPLIITTGWHQHACVVILIGDTIYRGNRSPQKEHPGIYKGTFNRTKLTIDFLSKIISNTSADWFEKTLSSSLGVHWTGIQKLRPQKHPNCTWSSCSELSTFIFQLHEGVATNKAWNYTKAIRAKVRLNFVKSYLSYDRTKMPHLHCPPLLGKILAKCFLKIDPSFPEYEEAAKLILTSGLSIDMMELMCTLKKQTPITNEQLDEALNYIAELGGLEKFNLFRLDPEFSPAEKQYRKTLEKLETQSLVYKDFYDTIDPISFLNIPSIPSWYKLCVIKELLSPFTAFKIFSLLAHEKELPSGLALIDNVKSAGLTTPERHLLKYKFTLEDINSASNASILTFLYKILDKENEVSLKRRPTREIKEIHEFLLFLLNDPRIGFILPFLLLERPDTLKRLNHYLPIEKLFSSLFKAKYAFTEHIKKFIEQPSFNEENGLRIFYQFIKDEPIHEQIRLAKIFFHALHISGLDTAVQITERLLTTLWDENPLIVENTFLDLLQSHTSDELGLSKVFPIFVDFFWEHDAEVIKTKLSANKLDVNLWPSGPRNLIRKHFPLDLERKTAPLPENFLEEILTKDLSALEKGNLMHFLSTHRIGNFVKTRRGDH